MLYVFSPFDNPEGIAEVDRQLFANACLKRLRLEIADSGYKKRENVLFCRVGDFFASATCLVASNRWESRVDIRIKPYALDPLLWRIINIDAKIFSVSARAFSGMQCQVPIWRWQAWNDKGMDPSDNCRKMYETRGLVDELISSVANLSFADLIIGTKNLDVPKHTLVLALVLERRINDAKAMAKKFLDDLPSEKGLRMMVSRTSDERPRNVLEVILDWIESDDRRELVPNSIREAP